MAEEYDENGFNAAGNHKSTGTAYDPEGFTNKGYDKSRYNRQGHSRWGFDRQGIHKDTGTCYDLTGRDRRGFDINGVRKPDLYQRTTDEWGINIAAQERVVD